MNTKDTILAYFEDMRYTVPADADGMLDDCIEAIKHHNPRYFEKRDVQIQVGPLMFSSVMAIREAPTLEEEHEARRSCIRGMLKFV